MTELRDKVNALWREISSAIANVSAATLEAMKEAAN